MIMESPEEWTKRFQAATLRIFVGCLLVWLGMHLLALVWPWLLLIGALAAGGKFVWMRWQDSREWW